MTARVMLLVHVRPGAEEDFEEAYRQVSKQLQGRIEGQLCDELLRPVSTQHPYILFSHWDTLDAYRAWIQLPSHRTSVAPLRQHWLHTDAQEYILVDAPAELATGGTSR